MEKPLYARIPTKTQTAQKAYSTPEVSTYLNYTQESSNQLRGSQVPSCRGHRHA
jgi:hypothetical protein